MAEILQFPTPKKKASSMRSARNMPASESRELQKRYVFNEYQTPADVDFVATDVKLLQRAEEYVCALVPFTSEIEYCVAQAHTLRELCEELLRTPRDTDLSPENTALVREFLYRVETARFFLHNVEVFPDGC